MYMSPVVYCSFIENNIETEQTQLQCSAQNGCMLKDEDCPLLLCFQALQGQKDRFNWPFYNR